MPSGICGGCGRETNSATSNWWNTRENRPTECYVAWVDGKPVKGCGYDKLDRTDRYSPVHFADQILKGSAQILTLKKGRKSEKKI
jgi:hypothetical protein